VRRSKFQRERQPIQAPADLDDCGNIRGIQHKNRPDSMRALNKKRDRAGACALGKRR